jgi:vacuolar-type H+-ATPase subunit I/STV1
LGAHTISFLADVVRSFIGFAAYFYSFGLYLSVISISHDANLRKLIQKLSIEEADRPHRRGSTQMQQEIQKQVVKLLRKHEEVSKEQTGVEKQHVTDDEIKQYVKDAMQEIQRAPRK